MALAKLKTAEEMARLDAIWAELEAHKDELEEPKPDTRTQAEKDEENRKAKIRRLSSLERKEFLGNVKSIVGNGGFTTKWEKILSQFILNNLAPMNEEINLLRNFAQGVSQRYEKANAPRVSRTTTTTTRFSPTALKRCLRHYDRPALTPPDA